MKTAKAILLNKNKNEIIELPIVSEDEEEGYTEALLKILDTDLENLKYLSFGYKYLIAWQTGRSERTSLELGVRAGFSQPYFVDSKVVIFRFDSEIRDDEEVSWLIDVDMDEIEKHFNTSPDNMFWTLIKM